VIVKTAEQPRETLEELEEFYGPDYPACLYEQPRHP
jgi:hypothetical protein